MKCVPPTTKIIIRHTITHMATQRMVKTVLIVLWLKLAWAEYMIAAPAMMLSPHITLTKSRPLTFCKLSGNSSGNHATPVHTTLKRLIMALHVYHAVAFCFVYITTSVMADKKVIKNGEIKRITTLADALSGILILFRQIFASHRGAKIEVKNQCISDPQQLVAHIPFPAWLATSLSVFSSTALNPKIQATHSAWVSYRQEKVLRWSYICKAVSMLTLWRLKMAKICWHRTAFSALSCRQNLYCPGTFHARCLPHKKEVYCPSVFGPRHLLRGCKVAVCTHIREGNTAWCRISWSMYSMGESFAMSKIWPSHKQL